MRANGFCNSGHFFEESAENAVSQAAPETDHSFTLAGRAAQQRLFPLLAQKRVLRVAPSRIKSALRRLTASLTLLPLPVLPDPYLMFRRYGINVTASLSIFVTLSFLSSSSP